MLVLFGYLRENNDKYFTVLTSDYLCEQVIQRHRDKNLMEIKYLFRFYRRK